MTVPGETGLADAKRLPPPLVLLAALVVMGALHQHLPGPELAPAPWNLVGWAGPGFFVAVAASVFLAFRRVGTTIKPHEESTALVTSGPFAWSRNPIYFSMVVALAGVAVVLGTATPWIVVPIFAWVVQRRFIAPEERKLEDAFGDDYRAYKARVRRWV